MTIELSPGQEQAIQNAIKAGAFRSVDEFMDAAIASLPNTQAVAVPSNTAPRKSRLWELRQGLSLGDITIEQLINEGRE
jgi:Arc/MetJ-type ribon-helix-helix transcriptional regulator